MSQIHYRVLRVVVPVTGKEPGEPVLLLTDIEHAVKTIYEDYDHSVGPVDAALTDSFTVDQEAMAELGRQLADNVRDERAGEKWAAKGQPEIEDLDELG